MVEDTDAVALGLPVCVGVTLGVVVAEEVAVGVGEASMHAWSKEMEAPLSKGLGMNPAVQFKQAVCPVVF